MQRPTGGVGEQGKFVGGEGEGGVGPNGYEHRRHVTAVLVVSGDAATATTSPPIQLPQ